LDPNVSTLGKIIANNPTYRIYGFLETQTLMALEGGMYKFV
jgi:hypothetical protein